MTELDRGAFEEMWGTETPIPRQEHNNNNDRSGGGIYAWGVLLVLSLLVMLWSLGSFTPGTIAGLVGASVSLVELRRIWENKGR